MDITLQARSAPGPENDLAMLEVEGGYLQGCFWLPVVLASLLCGGWAMIDEDVAEIVVIVHGPNFNGHAANLSNVLQRLFIQEIAGVGDLLGRPRSLPKTYHNSKSFHASYPISQYNKNIGNIKTYLQQQAGDWQIFSSSEDEFKGGILQEKFACKGNASSQTIKHS